MRVAMLDIYYAKLLTEDGYFTIWAPFALHLKYDRNISKRSLVKETQKQLKHIGENTHPNFDHWIAQLDKIWRDINKGDSITLFVTENGSSIFYLNHRPAGEILDAEFSTAFSNIWLSPQSSRPKLRKKLLGENQ